MSTFICKSAKRLVSRFWSDKKASVLTYFAFALLALGSGLGLATDSALAYLAKARMSKALDAAGLAAGRVAVGGDITAEALTFFNANFPASSLNTTVTSFTVTPSVGNQFITLNATAEIHTTFMRVVGVETTTIAAHAVILIGRQGVWNWPWSWTTQDRCGRAVKWMR